MNMFKFKVIIWLCLAEKRALSAATAFISLSITNMNQASDYLVI